MYLFIATIFIAELIIAAFVIILILTADVKVCELNNKVSDFIPVIETSLKSFHDAVVNLQNTYNSILKFIAKKRKQLIKKIVTAALIYMLLIFCKGRFKKSAMIFQTLVLVKDYIDELVT